MNTIRQRKGFESRAYTLAPESDFVEVEFNTIKEKLRYKIHLTEVGNEILYQADNMLVGKLFGDFLLLLPSLVPRIISWAIPKKRECTW